MGKLQKHFISAVPLFHPNFLFCIQNLQVFKPKRYIHLQTISEVTSSQHHLSIHHWTYRSLLAILKCRIARRLTSSRELPLEKVFQTHTEWRLYLHLEWNNQQYDLCRHAEKMGKLMSFLIWKTIQCSIIFWYHRSNACIVQSVPIVTFYFSSFSSTSEPGSNTSYRKKSCKVWSRNSLSDHFRNFLSHVKSS